MSALSIGSSAIPFSLPGTDGKTYQLSDYADKDAVAVIFTCNHCPYALAWEDRIMAVQSDYADKGVQVLVISANDAEKYPADSFEKMKEHAAEKNFPAPYLYDESQEIARAYGAERTPEIFLFDKSGKLQYHGAVDDNYEEPESVKESYFRDALEAVLAGKPVPTTETPPVGCTIKWKA